MTVSQTANQTVLKVVILKGTQPRGDQGHSMRGSTFKTQCEVIRAIFLEVIRAIFLEGSPCCVRCPHHVQQLAGQVPGVEGLDVGHVVDRPELGEPCDRVQCELLQPAPSARVLLFCCTPLSI